MQWCRTLSPARKRGLALLTVGTLLFVVLAVGEPAHGAGGFSAVAELLAAPLLQLLGWGAFALPVCIIAVAVHALWLGHCVPRRRWALRLLLSALLLPLALTGLMLLAGGSAESGGEIARLYYSFMRRAVGTPFDIIAGLGLAALAAACLWGSVVVRAHSVVAPLGGRVRCAALGLGAACAGVAAILRQRLKARIAGRCTASTARPRRPTDSLREPSAPWRAEPPSSRRSCLALRSEAARPDQPLPLDALPVWNALAADREGLDDRLSRLRALIVRTVARHTGIELKPVGTEVGYATATLVFSRRDPDRSRIGVARVQSAIPDIEAACRIGSIQVSFSDGVRFLVPLEGRERSEVALRPLLEETVPAPGADVSLVLGRRPDGTPFALSLQGDVQHLLVGGSSGSGKTTLLHTALHSILYHYPPGRCQVVLADHKGELAVYRGAPHLAGPVDVASSQEEFDAMTDFLFMELEARKRAPAGPDGAAKAPILLTIVDEFHAFEHERLATCIAEGRSLGLRFLFSTQHPLSISVSSHTKALCDGRIALRTADRSASRVILDSNDAADLAGRGDALARSTRGLERFQVAHVRPQELDALGRYLADRNHAGRAGISA